MQKPGKMLRDDSVDPRKLNQCVDILGLVGNASVATINGLSPTAGDAYVVTGIAGTVNPGTVSVVEGDMVQYDGTNWYKVVAMSGDVPPAGTRVTLSTQTALIAPYTDATDDGKVMEFDGADLEALIDTGNAQDGKVIFAKAENGNYENLGFIFDGAVPTGEWKTASPGAYDAGATGGLLLTGNSFSVKKDGTSIVTGASGSKAAMPTTGDKELTPAVTDGDDSDTGLAITNTPNGDGMVCVFVNGGLQTLGDGVKTKDCYFTDDAGATAMAIADIVATNELYWNGAIAEFDLDADDQVDLLYNFTS